MLQRELQAAREAWKGGTGQVESHMVEPATLMQVMGTSSGTTCRPELTRSPRICLVAPGRRRRAQSQQQQQGRLLQGVQLLLVLELQQALLAVVLHHVLLLLCVQGPWLAGLTWHSRPQSASWVAWACRMCQRRPYPTCCSC
jgi:hypothetical protein